MAITPQAGYMVDPNNPNGVVKIGDINSATGIAYGNVPTAVPGNVVTGTGPSLQQSPSGGVTSTPTIVPYNNNNATQTTAISPNTVGPGNILPTAPAPASTSPTTSVDLTPVGGNGSQVTPSAIPKSQFVGYNLPSSGDFIYNGQIYQVNGGYVLPDPGYPAWAAQDISKYAINQPTTQTPTATTPTATTPTTTDTTGQTPTATTPVAGQTTTQPTLPSTALQPGNTGDNVKALQDYLVSIGLMTQDQVNTGYGTYGPQTTAAVKALQESLNVDNSSGPGYFGPKTIAALQAKMAATGGQTQVNASGLTTGGTSPTQGTTPLPTGGTAAGGVADKYANLDPLSRQVQMYTDAATALGLPTIKGEYEKILKDQKDLTDKMNEEIANVRNNPWLSQGVADRTVERIQEKYRGRLDTLTHLETLYDSLYKTGQAQVEHIVSGAQADIQAANALAQKQLDAASALAKDNIVVIKDGRQYLVSKATGKAVADLGVDPNPPAVKTTSTTSSTATKAATTASMTADVQNAASQLQTIVRTKNFAGVDPGDYQVMADYLQKTYGTTAVAALKSALSALGLSVDIVGDGKGAN